MKKVISMQQSVYELVTADPAVMEIMVQLGFCDITKPGMLQTAGRFMTLAKGAKLKKIAPEVIKQTFRDHGYRIEND